MHMAGEWGEAALRDLGGGQQVLKVSHNGASVPPQGPLEADGSVNVLTSCAAHTLQKFTEEQEDMPVVFG